MRGFLTILVISAALAITAAVFVSSQSRPVSAPAPAPAPVTSPAVEQAGRELTDTEAVAAPDVAEPVEPTAFHDPGPLVVLSADRAMTSRIGSLDPASGYKLEVELTAWGAGIYNIWLTDYFKTPDRSEPYRIMTAAPEKPGVGSSPHHYPFAARTITVNGRRVDLQAQRWRLDAPGAYHVDIADEAGQPILRLTRRYELATGAAGYDLRCRQRVENLTGAPLRIVWEQNAQTDPTPDETTYMGDRREVVAGYHNLGYDPGRMHVFTNHAFTPRPTVISALLERHEQFWPNPDVPAPNELVWLAAVNRYFALATHLPVTLTHQGPAPSLDSLFAHQPIRVVGQPAPGQADRHALMFTLVSKPIDVPAGAAADLDVSLFAGPRKSQLLEQPPYRTFQFTELIVYSLGGMCAFCTFQWLAHGLLWFLRLIEGDVLAIAGTGIGVHDWGIAIIILVLVVRGILHPITKKSQINMMKMGKQMQTLQPELEKLKKKYKDDNQTLQRETMKLYREKGINPMNMLGCLPMLLQMPIWIALYAMLYFAIELRHEPAFYGVFQAISGGHWRFLADLSAQDGFIPLGGGFTIPLVDWTIDAINILPILMAVVFFIQQQLMTPPPANEQAAQQQKMMKWMTLLFPVFLYKAPAGLTLYIMASTLAGIVDSWIVRRHIKREEEAGTLLQAKPVKPGGFMDRIHKALEARQKQMAQMQKRK